jgi:hypothetical protein
MKVPVTGGAGPIGSEAVAFCDRSRSAVDRVGDHVPRAREHRSRRVLDHDPDTIVGEPLAVVRVHRDR